MTAQKKVYSAGYKVLAQRLLKCSPIFPKSVQIEGVVHKGTISRAPDQTCLPQYTQVLRDCRLGDAQLMC